MSGTNSNSDTILSLVSVVTNNAGIEPNKNGTKKRISGLFVIFFRNTGLDITNVAAAIAKISNRIL